MNENNTYPIERVLMDADHMAKVATELLASCASLAIASNAVNDEETAENLAALEQAEGILGEQAHAMRLAMHEYCKRAQRFRDSLADSATAEQAEPVAWVRFCSDGCYEGPIMNSDSRMDGVRRTSGAWTPLYAAQPPAVAARIRELEAQLNAATTARQEAQQVAQEAIEARNRAGVEIRRPLLKRIAELEAQQAVAPDDVAKDAARYRWMRQDESEFSSMAPAELDAAIDKAIAAAQKGGAA